MEPTVPQSPASLPTPATPNIPLLAKIPAARRRLGFERLRYFLPFYFSDYITHKAPPFHGEIIDLLQNETVNPFVTAAFRGSGKSTLVSLVYVLWAIMGKPRQKYIILVSKTQEQARQLLRNIRIELERNELLRRDLGPFHEEEDEWRNATLVISNFGARITAISVGQSMRGLRHGTHRCETFIFDDVEDYESVKTRESRNATWNWIMGDALPAGDLSTTRVIMVGSNLHADAAIQRYRKAIERNKVGCYRSYPLLDAAGVPLWKAKYPDAQAIETLKKQLPDEVAFQREYMLTLIAEDWQVIKPEWIHRYDPAILPRYPYPNDIYTAVDPAISLKTSADYTAMVSGELLGRGADQKLYILPDIVNKRMDINEMLDTLKDRSTRLGNGMKTMTFIEAQAFQMSLEQLLAKDRYPVEGVTVGGMDKRTRLALAAPYLRDGIVLFPLGPAGDRLVEQLTGFGIEAHDDLADALSMLVLKLLHTGKRTSMGMATYDPVTRQVVMTDLEAARQEAQMNMDNIRQWKKYRAAFVEKHGRAPMF